MQTTITLNQKEIEQALIEFVKREKNVESKRAHISYYQADSRDPRESSYFSATVTGE